MGIALWVVSGVLAAAYLFAGANKALTPKDKLVAGGLAWGEDFSPGTIKVIGIVEILGAIGLIVPWLTGILPVLTPIAATGLVLVQLLAIIVHFRRREAKVVPMNLLLLLAALSIAIFRFAAL